MGVFMNIRNILFISFLSFGAIVAASQSKPLEHDLPGILNYDQYDVVDWQMARDQWNRDIRMLQCSGIAKSLQDADKQQMLYGLMQYRSHLCNQFSVSDLREITQDLVRQRYADSQSELQAKCRTKSTAEQRAECQQGCLNVFALLSQDKDTLIHQLTHGGTKMAQAMAAKQQAEAGNANG